MRYILNGITTSVHMRFVESVVVRACPSCGADGLDNARYWIHCPALLAALRPICVGLHDIDMTDDIFHLQDELEGYQVQLIGSLLHAIWRCRCAIFRGLSFDSIKHLTAHIRQIFDNP